MSKQTGTLYLDEMTIPAAALGNAHPLVPLGASATNHPSGIEDDVCDEDRRYVGYGMVRSHLPYTVQGDYGRQRVPTRFRVAVLENAFLRATFLLDFGGRLYSLIHKPDSRELLYVNPVFQPVNFAIRNAWFTGGAEWNFGLPGHSVHTCDPLFAARCALDDGTPVLRMYEWERVRRMAYQIDAFLADGKALLFVRVRLVNEHDQETPVYWWTNIAMPDRTDARILAPADSALNFGYKRALSKVSFPKTADGDMSYPGNIPRANDFFFRIPDGHRPWVAWVDGEGQGLFHASTARLRGRKMFVYGQGPGGKSWQRFETEGHHPYMEIQAGLARTQAECLPMPPGSEWCWLEAMGPVDADAGAVHGDDWVGAWSAVEREIDRVAPMSRLDQMLEATRSMSRRAPGERLSRGSGWAELEERRLGRPIGDETVPFDGVLPTDECAPWETLLSTGALPATDPAQPPVSYMVQEQWRELLERSVADGRSDHWAGHFHLGVMHEYSGRRKAASDAWDRSMEQTPNAWAARFLGAAAHAEGQHDVACRHYVRAVRLLPTCLPLVIECGTAMLSADQPRRWLELLDSLRDSLPPSARLNTIEGRAALMLNDLNRVKRILDGDLTIPDLREREIVASDLWFAYHEKRVAAKENVPIDDELRQRVQNQFPPPAHLDFRMAKPAGA